MHISAKLLPKVCQDCQCWQWQNLKQQRHAHQCQIAVKSVPRLPVLTLAKLQTAATCTSVPKCCQKCAKSASAGTAEFLGNDMLLSVGTDLVLPSPMGSSSCTNWNIQMRLFSVKNRPTISGTHIMRRMIKAISRHILTRFTQKVRIFSKKPL